MRASAFLSLALLLIVQSARADAKQERVIVDLRTPPVEIRQILLKQTPVGSTVDYVVRFISKQLMVPRRCGDRSVERDGNGAAWR